MKKYLMCCVVAVVAMMGMTACSSDDDGGSSERANVVVYNGESKPVLRAGYGKNGYIYNGESNKPSGDDVPYGYRLYLGEDETANFLEVNVTNNLLGKRRELGDKAKDPNQEFWITYRDKSKDLYPSWENKKTNNIVDGSYLIVNKTGQKSIEIEFNITYKEDGKTNTLRGYYNGPFS